MPARKHRPYDCAIPHALITKIRERRINPDGVERAVKQTSRASVLILKYPWDDLGIGDFFIAPLNGARYDTAVNKMLQAARRRDVEISCIRWTIKYAETEEPGIRVTLVMQGLRQIKLSARNNHGHTLAIHDRANLLTRQRKQQKAQYRRTRSKDTPVLKIVAPPPKANPKPEFDLDAIVEATDTEILDRRAQLERMRKGEQ